MPIDCPSSLAPHTARAPRALTLRAPIAAVVRMLKAHRRPWILGASGGVDSTAAMLLLAHAQQPTLVVHVHHHLRDDADNDAQTVAHQAAMLGFPHVTVHLPPPPAAQIENLSARSRRLRYNALATYAARHHADILTAHHADDQLETFVMRLQRGTALPHAFGLKPRMQWQEQSVLRPLLSLWKSDLQDLVIAANFPWIEDSSNASDAYARNRLRRQMRPLIEQLSQHPKAAQTLAQLAQESADLSDAAAHHPTLATELQRTAPTLRRPADLGPDAHSIARLHALRAWSYNAAAFQHALYAWCKNQKIPPRHDVLQQISRALWEGIPMTRDLRGLRLVVTREALWLAPSVRPPSAFEGGGEAILHELHHDRWTQVGDHRLKLEGSDRSMRLWARPWQHGDRMRSPHSDRMVGVRKRMARDGVPAAVRDGAVVVLAHSSPTNDADASHGVIARSGADSSSQCVMAIENSAAQPPAEQRVIVGVLHALNQRLEIRTTPTMHLSVVRAN